MQRRTFLKNAAIGSLLFNLPGFAIPTKTHILTLSFDDGFKKSFYRIAEIHHAYGLKACLNVIATGHLPGFKAVGEFILPELMGDFDDWNTLQSKGHEIMPHTWEHLNLTEVTVEDAKDRMSKCFAYFQDNLDDYQNHRAVYNFAFNASTPELDAFALQRVRAVRTGAWLVLKETKINPIPTYHKPIALGCLSHGPDNCDEFVKAEVNEFLQGPGGWLILNLHGLDNEGWGPISSSYLDILLARLVKIDFLDVLPTGVVLDKS